MTKRRDVIKTIAAEAKRQGVVFGVEREGANHTVFNLDGLMIPIGRHNDLDNQMAEIIYKEAAEKLGKRWWK
jgi:alpha-L-fucosidase